MKTIFILMDSLNRHYLNAYNNSWIQTPNIDRLAQQGVVFDNHYCGSLPCMPARREMMTGRLNFLEAPWGPIEPWDDCLPTLLRQERQTYSHMITDHYHYFHSGGEAYHTLFDSWEFQRGQEGDVWHPLVRTPEPPDGVRGKGKLRRAYWANRKFQNSERDEDYSTPQCFMQAIDFLEHNHTEENWHLHLEVFDPHEPFDCPQKYRDLYNDTWDRYFYSWPDYAPLTNEDDAEAVAHIRKCYAGSLTMADYWLGRLLDKMDALNLWQDTTVILTADHGHLLGEHGYWAKNYMMDYAELARIPLIVSSPECTPGSRVGALTATMDLMPTCLELHGMNAPEQVHGKSFRHLIRAAPNPDARHHDAILYGYFGKDINLADGRYTYCRQPQADAPLYQYTAMPRGFSDFIDRDSLAAAEIGVFLDHTHSIPHFKVEHQSRRHRDAPDFNPIYDLHTDPGQEQPVRDDALEAQLAGKMRELLQRYDAPECQFTRCGL